MFLRDVTRVCTFVAVFSHITVPLYLTATLFPRRYLQEGLRQFRQVMTELHDEAERIHAGMV